MSDILIAVIVFAVLFLLAWIVELLRRAQALLTEIQEDVHSIEIHCDTISHSLLNPPL
jgi:hypothetical protein